MQGQGIAYHPASGIFSAFFPKRVSGRRNQSVSLAKMLCFVAAFCLPGPAISMDRTIRQYVHTAWSEKEGAPSGILALAQTSDGYLWIGAVDGLYRFDGVSFDRYQTGMSYALFSRPNGDLWVGRNGSIVLLRNGA
jgi:ligand-binding sensor domain-containing protein